MRPYRTVFAATAASGAIYAVRTLGALLMQPNTEICCIQSAASKAVFTAELGVPLLKDAVKKNMRSAVEAENTCAVEFFDEDDFSAPCASGSYAFDSMIISPCSMKTLGKIANSVADNLIVRAAEVALKERRKMVVVPRETPLAYTHLKNMETLVLAGAVVLPACPAFYAGARTMEDLADFIAARTLSCAGIEQKILPEWGVQNG